MFRPVPQPGPAVAPPAPETRSSWGLAWVALALAGATAVKLATFDTLGAATPFLLYFAPLIPAGWYWGWRGGLAMAFVSAVLGYVFFLPPFGELGPVEPKSALRLGAFVLESLAIVALAVKLRSERTRSELRAREERATAARLQAVLSGVSDGITVQTAAGELHYANDAAARLTGFASAEEMLRTPVREIMDRFELLAPDGTPFDTSQLPGRRVLQGLDAPEQVVRFRIRATNETRIARIRSRAVHLDDAGDRVAVNVFQDVTESHLQEEALRVSHEWFETTLRSIGDAVIATDAGGRITFMNPIAERLTGWEPAAAAGRLLEEVFSIVDEETRTRLDSPVARVLREGKVVGLANHTLLLRRTGPPIAIDDSAAPIRSPSGEVVGAVLIFRDVTERRGDDQRRAFLSRASAELAASLDYRSTLATVARLAVPAIADWCAIDMVDEGALQRLAVEHVDPDKKRLVFEIERRYPPSGGGSREVARTGQPVFAPRIPDEALVAAARDEEHLRMIRQLQLRSYIAVPLTAGGSTIGVLTMAMAESGRDYGERDLALALSLADRAAVAVHHARLYAAAGSARAEAERANRAKDEFLAMLGHELRNPLAPILTALELMRLRAPGAHERERAIVERQVRHLVALVDDLLDVSRITSGKIELAREVVDLSEIVGKSLELAGPLLEQRRHHVEVDVPSDLTVVADPVRLAQVFSNLLGNAAKYTKPGGRIEVVATREDGEVMVRVRDDGEGLPADLLPRVFDLFVQGGQSLERASGGLGLGLAIVKNVVELHGGRVSAHSDGLGKGSEFRVSLPGRVDAPLREEEVVVALRKRESGGRILVVDDNEDARELLQDALSMSGYDVDAAADAPDALTRAAATPPDVALLDIGLPVMDGYELARRLREMPGLERTKLVAITGYGQSADRERARAAGFDDHLVKPVSFDSLEAVIARLLKPTSASA